MNSIRASFIGAGNMAGSIIGGLLRAGFGAEAIRVASPGWDRLEQLRALGIEGVGTDNRAAVTGADVVVLCVKPQRMRDVCEELGPALADGQLVLSVAAGITSASIARWLGGSPLVVRCVPNTPSQLGAGATAVYAAAELSPEQKRAIETILGAIGVVCWVQDEEAMHSTTALSGSGPAYFFLLMEAMIDEAQRMGLDANTARTLCARTCAGAGLMLAGSDVGAAELRRRVTSPGGTTEQAVGVFEEAGLRDIAARAMQAAAARSRELAADHA